MEHQRSPIYMLRWVNIPTDREGGRVNGDLKGYEIEPQREYGMKRKQKWGHMAYGLDAIYRHGYAAYGESKHLSCTCRRIRFLGG